MSAVCKENDTIMPKVRVYSAGVAWNFRFGGRTIRKLIGGGGGGGAGEVEKKYSHKVKLNEKKFMPAN